MIQHQEELRGSQEKVRVLEEEIGDLQQQKSDLEKRLGGGAAESSLRPQELHEQAWLHARSPPSQELLEHHVFCLDRLNI